MSKTKTHKFEDTKAAFLADPKNKAEYDRQAPEFAIASAMIGARVKAGMSQAELAQKAGITQAQVSRIEGGQWPSAKTIAKLAKAMGKTATLKFI